MSEMIERVARAIHRTEGPWSDVPWDDLPESAKSASRRQARAAIEAMREPTLDMIHCSPVTADNFVPYPETCAVTWRAMIDEALTERDYARRSTSDAALAEGGPEAATTLASDPG